MNCAPSLRRLALLVALLPQLLLLGLGRGLVICVAPGGHVQVEVSAGGCCDEGGGAHAEARDGAHEEPDCGSCSDFALVRDLRWSRGTDIELDGPAPAALAPDARLPRPRDPRAGLHATGEPRASEGRSPHLRRLRGVVLRC